MTPKEDPEDKRRRLLERQTASRERRDASQKTAADLTTDINAVYGRMAGLSMFAPPKAVSIPKPVVAEYKGIDR